uniref:Uncharacterized protein n=1 Tax=Corethron hystrix TaxID=216773 RepID=A0A7S1BEA1_9STRA|mmetsp:Transcript_23541/g.53716  ORF Transcript_23541/g.53716 Transcript_23541/m.53716 type:complete len:304 (+) Transcript_23541:999-1910(+)
MRINAHHIDQYLKMSAEIDRLTSLDETVSPEEVEDPEIFNGPMTARQLRHAIPGFIRVEVMSSDTAPKDKYDSFARTSDVGIPVRETAASLLDADKCCGSPEANARLPSRPEPRDLMTWECALQGLAVRKFPGKIGWAALLPGPRQGEVKRRGMDPVHGFWTGSGGVFGADVKRPSEREPKFFSQQGGWMATRDQIIRFDEICTEGFLPPFKKSTGIKEDGLDPRQPHNVEFWSGGFQLFGTCNIQRIISMEPEHFSRQLLYHSSNNKQKTIAKERLKSVRDLYGQLATVVQTAEAKLESRVQ